jgi:hypothetical protein
VCLNFEKFKNFNFFKKKIAKKNLKKSKFQISIFFAFELFKFEFPNLNMFCIFLFIFLFLFPVFFKSKQNLKSIFKFKHFLKSFLNI